MTSVFVLARLELCRAVGSGLTGVESLGCAGFEDIVGIGRREDVRKWRMDIPCSTRVSEFVGPYIALCLSSTTGLMEMTIK